MYSLSRLWVWDDDIAFLLAAGAVGSGFGPDIELTLTVNRTASLTATIGTSVGLSSSINRKISEESELT